MLGVYYRIGEPSDTQMGCTNIATQHLTQTRVIEQKP